jgi:sporulation protein YlmC with PRC-barrel domain
MKDFKKNRMSRASTFKNTTVKNAISEKVGKVEDIMIDTSTGEASYVVLSVDSGFLNLGNKYFAVPWQAFKFDTEQEDIFILNVEKEKLKNAPGFDKDNWPSTPQNEFLLEVQTYYGYSKDNDPNPPLSTTGRTDTIRNNPDTIRDTDDRRDPNPKKTNFI